MCADSIGLASGSADGAGAGAGAVVLVVVVLVLMLPALLTPFASRPSLFSAGTQPDTLLGLSVRLKNCLSCTALR